MTDGEHRTACIAGILACVLAAGCAGVAVKPMEPSAEPEIQPVPTAPVEPEPPPPVTEKPKAAEPATPVPEPVRAPAPVIAPSAPTATTTAPPPAGTPAAAKPPVAGAAPKGTTAAPAAAPPLVTATPSKPVLDLDSLETRLKETRAIGVFTKISLKNQVDDLLDRFRAYYKGQAKTSLAELRRPYDMLLMKVLSLLQDTDPPLAHDIVVSKEAIWGVLADEKKFTEANLMAGDTT